MQEIQLYRIELACKTAPSHPVSSRDFPQFTARLRTHYSVIYSTMIAQVGRSAACIRQLHVQCLTACLASPGPKHLERVLNLHTLLPIRDGLSKTFISLQTHRSYATRPVSRPKQHTGRTTSTRKTPTTSATKAAKVPRPKKATAKSTPKAKSKAKPKPRKKAKGRSKSKPKPKSKRKILTEKQKQQKATKVQKDKIASLKEAALQPPVGTPRTAWSVLLVETVKTQRSGSGRAPNASKEASQKFKSLSPEELEASPLLRQPHPHCADCLLALQSPCKSK